MAINTNPVFQFGQDIPREALTPWLARANLGTMDYTPGAEGGWNERTSWSDPTLGRFSPSIGYDNSGGSRRVLISQPRNASTWGGSDATGVWDADGKWQGYSTGAADLRNVANFAASSLAAYYGTDLLNGANPTSTLSSAAAAPTATAATPTTVGTAGGVVGGGLTVPASASNALTAGLSNAAVTAGAAAVPAAAPSVLGGLTGAQMAQIGLGALSTVNSIANNRRVAGIADRQMDLAETAYADNQDFLSQMRPLITQSIQQTLAAGQRNIDRGDSLWSDYMATWRPVEQRFAQEALSYNTAGRRESAAQQATGQVATEFDTARRDTERDMIAAGLDPSTIAALGASSRIQEAVARAGAANQARTNVETTGLNLLQAGSNFGRGIPQLGLSSSQAGTNQSGQAANATGQAVSTNNNAASTTSSMMSSAAGTLNTANNNQNALIGDLFSAWGKLYGMYGGS